MAREYMCAYHSLTETARCLNDAEFGRLMRAAIQYSACREAPTLSGRESVLWDMVRWQIDRDIEKFDAFAEKQAENGRKGGRPKKPKETQKTQAFSEKPKKTKAIAINNEKQIVSHNPLTPFEGAVADFIAHRKKLGKPMTDRAVELFKDRLDKLASRESDKIALINTAIERGWQTVYPPDKPQKKRGANTNYPQRSYDEKDLDGVLMDFSKEVL